MKKQNLADGQITRRSFLTTTGAIALGTYFLPPLMWANNFAEEDLIKPCGPASEYQPTLMAAFVRRKGDYGMWWPGQVYDGEAAFKNYKQQILASVQKLNMTVDIRPQPIYSPEEADQWIKEVKSKNPDGLMVVALDRQQHAWPTVDKAINTNIPTVVFSPLGTSFTTNTTKPSKQEGVFICSTDDFNQAAFGIKSIFAGAKLRETKFLVIKGNERKDSTINHIGTKLHYLPSQEFIKEYNSIKNNPLLTKLADGLINDATRMHGSSRQDVINGIKSYIVAKNLLERENCDAITMDCLGTLAREKISLPCIAWSRMNDHGIPAACEADLGACATHAIVQYLFDRPGFQQDPVAETSKDCLIGSHCSCPTKLNGFSGGSEPYEIMPHHANRDATAKPLWKIGQRITVADMLLSDGNSKTEMIISAGYVIDNKSIPPSGGCVVAPMVKLDNVSEMLDYPGFHQIFFYGDYKKELKSYCQLYKIRPIVV
jgi:hypothetical protein